MIDMKKTGANINRYRVDRGFTVLDLAEKLQVTRAAVYKWIYGNNMPTVDNFVELAQLLDTTIDNLIIAEVKVKK